MSYFKIIIKYMGFLIDENNKLCYIMAPKSGSTTIANYLNIDQNIIYGDEKTLNILNDQSYKKIIIIRKNIVARFLSGFYEDLFNNTCYDSMDITFKEYLDFLYFCYKNKIKEVNNLNVFMNNNNSVVYWGNCSNKILPLTNADGNFISHIQSQKYALCNFITDVDCPNTYLIELSNLNYIITDTHKNKKSANYQEPISNLSLSYIKKNELIIKNKQLSDEEINIIMDMYSEDKLFLNYLENRFKYIDLPLHKTLIGKNGYLFLINDSARELEVHCDNLNLIKNPNLDHLTKANYFLTIFPNKSLVYKDFLPDEYSVKYRPAFDIYKNVLQNKMMDGYDVLKNEEDVYYKTDTHINFKGAYLVYNYFVTKINQIYKFNIKPKQICIKKKECKLNECNVGIGDLLWDNNLGDQIIDDRFDTYYYSDEVRNIYNEYIIHSNGSLRLLDYKLNDITDTLNGVILHWNIISKHIIFKNNNECNNNYKVLIFYDSFLLSSLPLYLEMFTNIYMIKSVYSNELIELIQPDYVFEFRVERFLF